MGMEPISRDLYNLLMRQGLAGDRAGTRKLARKVRAKAGTNAGGIKGRSSVSDDALPGVAGREDGSPIYLAWTNPTAMRQGTRRKTSVPFLMIVSE